MNALEKIVDLLIAVVLMFLVPVLYYSGKHQLSETIMAAQAGKHFLNRISVSGEITVPVWKELERNLAMYGCAEFSLQRERDLYEPTENPGEIVERTYCLEKEQIEKQIREQGACLLQKGDRMSLTIYREQAPMTYCEYIRTGATKR